MLNLDTREERTPPTPYPPPLAPLCLPPLRPRRRQAVGGRYHTLVLPPSRSFKRGTPAVSVALVAAAAPITTGEGARVAHLPNALGSASTPRRGRRPPLRWRGGGMGGTGVAADAPPLPFRSPPLSGQHARGLGGSGACWQRAGGCGGVGCWRGGWSGGWGGAGLAGRVGGELEESMRGGWVTQAGVPPNAQRPRRGEVGGAA